MEEEMNLTITAPKGSIATFPIGRVPGGYRVQFSYTNAVTFAGESSVLDGTVNPFKVRGWVAAGTDWVLLRDDGVAVFDANITFEADAPGTHVFDADLYGQVDLKQRGFTYAGAIQTPSDWRNLKGTLNMKLPIQFETSDNVPPGASHALIRAAENGAYFADLAKDQFFAIGTIEIESGEIIDVTLDVVSAADFVRSLPQAVQGLKHSGRYPRNPDPFVNLLFEATADNWLALRTVLAQTDVITHITSSLMSKSKISAEDVNSLIETLVEVSHCDWHEAEPVLHSICDRILDRAA